MVVRLYTTASGAAATIVRMDAADPPVTENHIRLREIGLALPGAFETTQLHDHRVLKVGKKTFLWLDEAGEAVNVKVAPEDREILLQDPRFSVAAYIGQHGWMVFKFGASPDWDEVAEFVVGSYRLCALKRHLRELDAG